MTQAPTWVGRWFRGAAIYGALALIAGLLAQAATGRPTLDGLAFAFTALAFQIVFWIVGGDPVRHRPVMLAGVAEKLAFGVPALAFAASGRAEAAVAIFALIDLVLGLGFTLAWRATPASRGS
jgi:hypothetical protein